jgi:hypothetical protein
MSSLSHTYFWSGKKNTREMKEGRRRMEWEEAFWSALAESQ